MNTAFAYRLSSQQQSLLLSKNDLFYNKLVFSLPGRFTLKDVEDAVVQLLDCYEAFKLSVYESEQGEWLQSAGQEVIISFSGERSQPGIMERVSTGDPVVRVFLQEGDNEINVAILANPLIADISSLYIVQQQLTDVLDKGLAPEEEIGYLQYAEWQHQLQESEDLTEASAFWSAQYKGVQPVLRNELKYAGHQQDVATSTMILPPDLGGLEDEESIFFASFLDMLRMLTDSECILVGIECHGREFDELKDTVGLLSKVLPCTHKGAVAAADILHNMKAFQFYHAAEQVFDYQFGYLMQNSTAEGLQWLQGRKLKCQVISDDRGISVIFLYHPGYFRIEDIRQMQELYIALLAERTGNKQQLVNFRTSFAEKVCRAAVEVECRFVHIVDACKAIALQFPGHTAVRSLSGSLSYQELDEYSDKAAALLTDHYGVTAGDFVGVMMPEDHWLPVAFLAIMKAGAAYVPIDAGNPPARIQQILSDASLRCLLVNEEHPGYPVQTIRFRKLWQQQDVLFVPPAFTGNETACMIYTSGTTGAPKGVMVSGNNLLNYTDWLRQTFQITEQDQSILQASYAYDLGYTSLWGCLSTGAAVHIIPAEKRQDADWLIAYIGEQKISFLKLTPSVCYLMLQAENVALLSDSSLRLVFSGGEKIDIGGIQRFAALKPDIQFVNHYGPTETTIGTLYQPVSLPDFAAKPVIGKPVSGNEVFIVNEAGAFCVPGEKGEILIAGKGVTKGYYDRDELNSEKFREIVLNGRTLRVYHSGDIGCWMGDGTVWLEGRKDNQVKIHGHRVELGEIRKALQFPGVNEVYLHLMPSRSFGEELVCYYLSDDAIDQAAWRKALLKVLPEYMIPAFFIRLDKLPLTANGKVDESRFPDPYQHLDQQPADDSRLTATERIIAGIWSEVLGLHIHAGSDFFASGGDSIKAIQIVAKLNKKGLHCQLPDIFNYTTVSALAAHLRPGKPVAGHYRLLPMQEAMYYHYKVFPASAANYIIRHFHISGAFQPELMKQAIDDAIQQFDILRLRFFTGEDHYFYCTVSDDKTSYVEITEGDDVAATKKQWLQEGFDLSAGPVMKVKIFLQPGGAQLLLAYHHIIMDGWCFQLIIQQIMACYEALCMGRVHTWRKSTSFTKYLEWIQGKDLAASRTFWGHYLQGYDTLATIPATGAADDAYDAGEYALTLSAGLTAQIGALCAKLKLTPSTFMQVAWGILLGNYNNTTDVVFGITVSGRPYEMEGFEDLLGLFINTLPVRIRWEGHSIASLLELTRNYLFDIQQHQYLSLAEIQSCSALKKDLLDHVLIFENYPLSNMERSMANTNISVVSESGAAQVGYPLAVVVYPGTSSIVNFMYNRNRYTDEAIAKMGDCLVQVLQHMVDDPGKRITEVDIVPEQERLALLKAGEPYGSYDPAVNIVTAIEAVTLACPQKIALEDGHQSVSYADMHLQVQRVAGWLINKHNIRKGDHVLICLPPSVELIIAMLAVLKAGATYVPVDVEYPEDRKIFIAVDSEAKAMISNRAFSNALSGVPLILMEDVPPVVLAVKMPVISGDDIAYMIYTSGSTGKPKGCQVKHSNLQHLFLQQEPWLEFSSADKWIMAHSAAFDFSVWEMYGALVNGGSLYIPDRHQVRDAGLFCRLLEEKGITILNQTPSSFYGLLDLIQPGDLRMVIFGGDVLDFTKLRKWLDIPGHEQVALYNLYGITETTVHVTWHQVTEEEILNAKGSSYIGAPLPGASVYIMNRQLQLCPEGVFGEICVGGDGVSAGYYNNRALTDQKFISHHLNDEGKLYRSGDTGRWLPGGVLEFGGRIDDQVKVRGYRIEPGEIVSRLQEHPAVRQACVIPVNVTGATSLAAYIVFTGEPLPVKELRAFLALTLPAHFIPQYFIPVAVLPLTANGKVDKRKLPAPTVTAAVAESDDEIEQYLIWLWSRELGQPVSPQDNFFECGGHSLVSFRIISAVQAKFNVKLPVIQLYHDPVLKDFAACIRQYMAGMDQQVEADYVVLKEGPADKTLFFFPPAVGYAIGFGKLAELLEGYRVIGINFIEEDTIAKMAAIVQQLQATGPLVFCGFSAGGSLGYHVAQALEKAGRSVKALVFLDSRRFLAAEPLEEAMIRQIAADYLDDPRAKAVISSPEMADVMRRRIEASTRFIHQLEDRGMVDADIFYISSEENSNNADRWSAWEAVTKGRVVVYKGKGPHVSMLDREHLSQNLQVYTEILHEIFP
ncbi:non-ribosomal peptide synthetase [Chitinophaga filiformis]|uniref:Amino acid adenylation domain-containing protein n=1 Tax=Chitinophaga filiformis TaxID=104663 RepID=A0ABY4HS92_CHIFI|nr:non-ribosomal peptide synthetase [Chitinophaga filiformis]UPK66619.1 amino acid adenylation domain-containing protein [Chitinophaga filiformis]